MCGDVEGALHVQYELYLQYNWPRLVHTPG